MCRYVCINTHHFSSRALLLKLIRSSTRLKLALCLLLAGLLLLYIAFSDNELTSANDYKIGLPLHPAETSHEGKVPNNHTTETSGEKGKAGGEEQPLIIKLLSSSPATSAAALAELVSGKAQRRPAPVVSTHNEASLDLPEMPSYVERFMRSHNITESEILEAVGGNISVLDEKTLLRLDDNLDAMNGSNWKYGCRVLQLCLLFAMFNSTAFAAPNSPFVPQDPELESCPAVPPSLVGPIKVWMDTPSMKKLEQLYPDLGPGGHGRPEECLARHRVAIIIPYRDRESHLKKLLHNLHSLLAKQQLDYAIFVIEQVDNQTFNRGKLMNIGFREASKLYDWQCFIFHDVDLLPEDDRNLYSCPEQPRHMSVAIDKFGYKLPYWSIFGGISAMRREHYEKLNGFSNDYWGWGGEDDDISTRVSLAGLSISRYPTEIARYKMIKHSHDSSNPVNKCRFKLLQKTKERWQEDGLANLNYKVVDVEFNPLYTNIKVDLLERDSRNRLKAQHVGKGC